MGNITWSIFLHFPFCFHTSVKVYFSFSIPLKHIHNLSFHCSNSCNSHFSYISRMWLLLQPLYTCLLLSPIPSLFGIVLYSQDVSQQQIQQICSRSYVTGHGRKASLFLEKQTEHKGKKKRKVVWYNLG